MRIHREDLKMWAGTTMSRKWKDAERYAQQLEGEGKEVEIHWGEKGKVIVGGREFS